ncbi:helix-turn-helix domain-containing protein [Glycomyces sp. NPDC047369]
MADRAFDARTSLRSLRLRAMMTQEELAFSAGLGIRTVRDIESGKVQPQPKTLRLLTEALGLGEEDRRRLADELRRTASVPRELPMALAAFAGRESHLDALFAAVDEGAAVVAVHGMAGVGKTSLAVRAAHALAPRFPDGQVFVDLHGFTHPAGPRPGVESVLTRVLRSLHGTDRPLPSDLDELTSRYRSAVADRRVLLVFDNAASAEQLGALLPGVPGSLVLATSRHDLSSLAGASAMALEPPPMREAVAMLSAAVADRITDDEAVAIAERCGSLPLAMGLAAARLRSRPQWRVEDLLTRLAGHGLLDEFGMGHQGVAGALRGSYVELDPDHRRLFRRLGLVPGDDVDVHAAVALCEEDAERTAAMLEALVDVHLVETRSPGRYRLHDLVRQFAAGLAAAEETRAERDGVLKRLFDWYLDAADAACTSRYPGYARLLGGAGTTGVPGVDDPARADRWLAEERENLVAVARFAGEHGFGSVAWRLADTLRGHAFMDMGTADFLALGQAALHGARAEASAAGEATAELFMSTAYVKGRDFEAVIRSSERVVDLSRRLGWDFGEASAHHNLTLASWNLGRLRAALEHGEAALAMNREGGRARAVSVNLGALGVVHGDMGRPRVELRLLEESLEIAEEIGDVRLQASHLRSLTSVWIRLGSVATAERYLNRLMTIEANAGDKEISASSAVYVAELHSAHGRHLDALEHADLVVRQAALRGDRLTKASGLVSVAAALNGLGRPEEAVDAAAQALEVVDGGLPGTRIKALVERAVGNLALGRPDAAEADAGLILELAREGGYRAAEATALDIMSEVRLRGGDAAASRRHRGEVEAICAEMDAPVPARFKTASA